MAFTPLDPVVDEQAIEVEWGNKVVTATTELQVAATELQGDMIAAEARLDGLETFRVGCLLTRAVSQIAVPGLTQVIWDTESDDTSGYITVPNSNIVIPSGLDGLYGLTTRITSGGNWTAGTYLRITLESEEFRYDASGTTMNGTIIRYMYPTDIITVAIQNVGVSGLGFTGNISLYRL